MRASADELAYRHRSAESETAADAIQTLACAPALGLYVHFPWCVKKCPYCDFNSHPLHGALEEDAYIRALTSEFNARTGSAAPNEPWQFDSLFLGGGTPSLFSAAALARLIEAFRPFLPAEAEATMEANPGAAERDDLGACRDAGINRLSIGAQSFSAVQLKRLGRIHGPDETRACVAAARRGGFDNINLDIMYGLPGQTVEEALADLAAAIELAPEHLSWYQLTIEPKTEFARRPPANIPSESAIIAMESAGRAMLRQAGYTRYEISAYAKPGAACRHNLVYWTFGDYLGLGAGAHGKIGAARTSNPRQPRLYLQNPARTETTPIKPRDLPGEFMMNALRLVGGVEQSLFAARTGLPWSTIEPAWEKLNNLGLTETDRLAATPRGLQLLDTLVQSFL